MYKELEKYRTNNTIPSIIEINHQIVNITLDEYQFGLGDVIIDFINHEKTPWWKRKNYHSHLTEIYIKVLNKIKISYGF